MAGPAVCNFDDNVVVVLLQLVVNIVGLLVLARVEQGYWKEETGHSDKLEHIPGWVACSSSEKIKQHLTICPHFL